LKNETQRFYCDYLFQFVHSIVAQLGAWEKFEAGTGVMTYFYGAFQRLFINSGMRNELTKLKQTYPGYKVWITGHSLGGSLAAMTALYLVNQTVFPADRIRLVTFGEPRTGNITGHSLGGSLAAMTALYLVNQTVFPADRIRLVTFGEPRTGNVAFARAVEENVKFRYRVVHRNDLMTNVPTSMDPAGVFVTTAIAERQPHFYRHLVFYDNDMKRGDKFDVCDLSEDHACRNLAAANNILDHTSYFGINADDYLKQQCKKDLLN
uniref:Lipase_3 domain-containing protein n=1 Tax=Ascaris lumbricoides TaxID=6252 RepID=A0A0M3IA05_ASCLU